MTGSLAVCSPAALVAAPGEPLEEEDGDEDFGEAVHVWKVQGDGFDELPELRGHTNDIGTVALSADGRWAASGSADQTTRLWKLETRAQVAVIKHRSWVQGVTFNPAGTLVAVAGGRSAGLYSVPEGKKMWAFSDHRGQVGSVAFSPSGKSLLSASEDGAVRHWDLETHRLLAVFRWKIGPVYAVAFAPNGMLAAAGGKADLIVWDVDER
jgi:WD40 repeat protein